MWKMINASNAVEGMALTIRFAEPANSLVSRRAMAVLESAARPEGFIDKQPLQQFQIDINAQAVRQSSTSGIALQHNSVKRNHFGIVEQTVLRQLVYQPEQLILQINDYRSWEKEWSSASKIFAPTLEILSLAVPIQAFRLEYLNRFVFDGDSREAIPAGLLKSSEIISNIGLNSNDMWHSHAGRFDQQNESGRRLIQVNADMQDLADNHPLKGHRTLALMLAVERQFFKPAAENEDLVSKVDEFFTSLHDDIHVLFKQLVDSKFASKNGLPA